MCCCSKATHSPSLCPSKLCTVPSLTYSSLLFPPINAHVPISLLPLSSTAIVCSPRRQIFYSKKPQSLDLITNTLNAATINTSHCWPSSTIPYFNLLQHTRWQCPLYSPILIPSSQTLYCYIPRFTALFPGFVTLPPATTFLFWNVDSDVNKNTQTELTSREPKPLAHNTPVHIHTHREMSDLFCWLGTLVTMGRWWKEVEVDIHLQSETPPSAASWFSFTSQAPIICVQPVNPGDKISFKGWTWTSIMSRLVWG